MHTSRREIVVTQGAAALSLRLTISIDGKELARGVTMRRHVAGRLNPVRKRPHKSPFPGLTNHWIFEHAALGDSLYIKDAPTGVRALSQILGRSQSIGKELARGVTMRQKTDRDRLSGSE